MNKEVRELIARAKRHGWIDDGYTGKGHRRLVWPATGEAVVMASTPSEPSGLKWALRDLERIGGPLGSIARAREVERSASCGAGQGEDSCSARPGSGAAHGRDHPQWRGWGMGGRRSLRD